MIKVIILSTLFILGIHWQLTWSSVIHSSEEVQIYGGHDINITEAPYMVSVLRSGFPYCGGAILSRNFILTTGYCVHCKANYTVRVGTSIVEKGGKVYRIEKIIIHPNHWTPYQGYDVAVLWLTKPLNFDDSVKPIPMIEKDTNIPEGETTSLTGWGFTKHNNEVSNVLQKVEIQIASQEKCQSDYDGALRFNITNTMLCAGYSFPDDKRKGPGFFDEGDPLVYKGQLVGLASWWLSPIETKLSATSHTGYPKTYFPAIFANISTLRPWVDEVITSLTMYE